MMAVAAFITTMNFFASAEMSAAASALRLATSGATPPVSLRMNSSFLPATVSPCSFTYSLMALSICVAASANWPEYGMISPILTVCAPADDTAASNTNAATKFRIMVGFSSCGFSFGLDVRQAHDLRVLADFRAHELLELGRRVADRLRTERLETLAEQGVGKSGAYFRVHAIENVRRRARGREHAEPAAVVLEARHAGLGRGRDVGHLRVALRVGVGERAQPARLELLQDRRRSREHHLRLTRNRRRHRGAGAFVGDVQQVRPGAVVEQLAREVQGVADPR